MQGPILYLGVQCSKKTRPGIAEQNNDGYYSQQKTQELLAHLFFELVNLMILSLNFKLTNQSFCDDTKTISIIEKKPKERIINQTTTL